MSNATKESLSGDYNPIRDFATVELTQNSGADVVVLDADYGVNGVAGWVECPVGAPQGINAAGDRWCRNQQLKYNLNVAYLDYREDAGSRAALACHEFGHTVGLQHWSGTTCMYPNDPNAYSGLNSIDITDVNNYY
jgi:hypothetical protein